MALINPFSISKNEARHVTEPWWTIWNVSSFAVNRNLGYEVEFERSIILEEFVSNKHTRIPSIVSSPALPQRALNVQLISMTQGDHERHQSPTVRMSLTAKDADFTTANNSII